MIRFVAATGQHICGFFALSVVPKVRCAPLESMINPTWDILAAPATFDWDRFIVIRLWIFVLFLIYETVTELNPVR